MSIMALNDNKAGMQGLDKEHINKIIYEASKGESSLHQLSFLCVIQLCSSVVLLLQNGFRFCYFQCSHIVFISFLKNLNLQDLFLVYCCN